MYVPYQCCQKSLEEYYANQTGGGAEFYQGAVHQRGYGFGGIFRSLFRAAVPLLKSGAKAIGQQLWHSGVDTIKDISQGEEVRTAVRRRLKEAGRNLTDQASSKVKNMIGSGQNQRNKKRKLETQSITSRKTKKVKTHADIFS